MKSYLPPEKRVRINKAIKAETVRIVGPDSQQIGIMPIERALYMAKDLGLDLIEVAPQAKPPVCKITDYGKYRYEQEKREKIQKKKQKSPEMKEVTFRPSIDKHDFEVKVRHLKEFLKSNHKTKIRVRFRGAELAHKERGSELLSAVEKELKDFGKVVKPIHMEGSSMAMIIAPNSSPISKNGVLGVKKDVETKNKKISS